MCFRRILATALLGTSAIFANSASSATISLTYHAGLTDIAAISNKGLIRTDFTFSFETVVTRSFIAASHNGLFPLVASGTVATITMNYDPNERQGTQYPLGFLRGEISFGGADSFSQFYEASYDTTTATMSFSNSRGQTEGPRDFDFLTLSLSSCGPTGETSFFAFQESVEAGCGVVSSGVFVGHENSSGTKSRLVISGSDTVAASSTISGVSVPASLPLLAGAMALGMAYARRKS